MCRCLSSGIQEPDNPSEVSTRLPNMLVSKWGILISNLHTLQNSSIGKLNTNSCDREKCQVLESSDEETRLGGNPGQDLHNFDRLHPKHTRCWDKDISQSHRWTSLHIMRQIPLPSSFQMRKWGQGAKKPKVRANRWPSQDVGSVRSLLQWPVMHRPPAPLYSRPSSAL